MITHIHGKLVEKTPTYVVIDCNGIGYKIKISLQTFSSIDGEHCKLFSGVGPSTAQVILSTFSPQEIIHHITTADVVAVQSVKGIGAKTAQRIIIDLKDKVAKGMPTSDLLFDAVGNTIKEEALSALLALGFAKKGAESKIDKVLKSNPEIVTVEDLVRTALSQM